MNRQFQWAGNSLIDEGLLVCYRCLDVPQEQLRSPILPADPYPRMNPRVSPNTTPVPASIGQPLPTSPDTQGFTVFTLGFAPIQPGVLPPAPPTPPPPVAVPSLDFSKAGNSQFIWML